MDKTDYPLLSIVAIVAVVAIVAIFLDARATDGFMPLDQGVSLVANAVFDVPLTGHVTAGVPLKTLPATDPNSKYDLNDNGKLDVSDADILGNVIDRMRFCPMNKQCDMNSDGVIDMQDLAVINGKILASGSVPVAQPSAAIKHKDLSQQVGSFGATA